MAPVDPTMMYAIMAGIILFIILVVTLINKFSSKSSSHDKAKKPVDVQPQNRGAVAGPGGVRRRGPRVNRMRLNQDDSDASPDEDAAVDVDEVQGEGKVGAKKLRKLQEKAERKAMREQEDKDREERKKREKEFETKRKEDEELQKKEESLKEEEERKKKEEQERIEHEEYLKMKEMFSVDEEGEGDQEADLEDESLLQQFISYVKETKVVMLEDLAGHFKLKTQDVIQRVQDLQAEGTLTGVIDDRGKFIYITKEELDSVARFIKQSGRVSISDLANSINRIINLDPDNSAIVKKVTAEVGDIINVDEEVAAS